ncbi:MAG: helix-turn-helix transcriptional regulator [Chamaesiphon sp.]|nr:helix-turn-helix transcriptional regulator [Chamaesiphon sp.]
MDRQTTHCRHDVSNPGQLICTGERLCLAIVAKIISTALNFCRLFKRSMGMTPHAYLIQQRVERSKQLLKRGEGTLLDIAIDCGFANPSHFAKHFRRLTGISPKQFRMI